MSCLRHLMLCSLSLRLYPCVLVLGLTAHVGFAQPSDFFSQAKVRALAQETLEVAK